MKAVLHKKIPSATSVEEVSHPFKSVNTKIHIFEKLSDIFNKILHQLRKN